MYLATQSCNSPKKQLLSPRTSTFFKANCFRHKQSAEKEEFGHFFKVSSGISSKSSSSQKSSKLTAPCAGHQHIWNRKLAQKDVKNPLQGLSSDLLVDVNHVPVSVKLFLREVLHQNSSLGRTATGIDGSHMFTLCLVSTLQSYFWLKPLEAVVPANVKACRLGSAAHVFGYSSTCSRRLLAHEKGRNVDQ